MDDQPRSRRRNAVWMSAVGLVAAGAVGGGILATTVSASADPTATPSSSSSTLAGDRADGPSHGGARSVRGDEKSVSAADEATIQAAALKAVAGGTVYRVETDAGDGEYEAHMTKADGSEVTVKFDKDLKVIGVATGMGKGDPALTGQAPR